MAAALGGGIGESDRPVADQPVLGGTAGCLRVFTGVQSVTYWSSTTNADVSPSATSTKLLLNFDDGTVSPTPKSNTANFWCVRGPMSESAY